MPATRVPPCTTTHRDPIRERRMRQHAGIECEVTDLGDGTVDVRMFREAFDKLSGERGYDVHGRALGRQLPKRGDR